MGRRKGRRLEDWKGEEGWEAKVQFSTQRMAGEDWKEEGEWKEWKMGGGRGMGRGLFVSDFGLFCV